MKKLIYSVLFASLMIFSVHASDAGLFSYNHDQVNTEMSQLTTLETFIIENQGMTYSQVAESGMGMLLTNVNGPASVNFSIGDMDWGAFAWGFCCWPIGLFTVVFNDDKDENSKRSYLFGFLTGIILGAFGTVINALTYY